MANIFTENKILGWKLQEKRGKLTQEYVAEKLDISVDTLSNYENGKTKIPAVICRKLSKLYGVKDDDLWDDNDEDIVSELHKLIDVSNEKEVRYMYNVLIGLQSLKA